MVEKAVFSGHAVRRLRKRETLTQSAMAARLRISASYLNLIERNQRPISARVLMNLIAEFGFQPEDVTWEAKVGGVEGLTRRLSDDRFADLEIDRHDVASLLSESPQIAAAFSRLYDEAGTGGKNTPQDPMTVARQAIERWRNHFSDLDHQAEALADEMRISRGDVTIALVERLRDVHQLAVRILPREIMPDHRRRLDLHARQVQLAEMLGPRSRTFQLAIQVALLEHRERIQNLANGAEIADQSARSLFERHLASYFAAALIMPYGRFLRACEATGYDLPVLLRRFGVSFEQLAHRLTTLQRVGQRGLPFFMARVDRAGQLSKLYTGASGALFLDGGQVCPLWCGVHAFERKNELLKQTATLRGSGHEDGDWFCVARTVATGGAGVESGQHTIILGVEASLAADLAQKRLLPKGDDTPAHIGPGCRRCLRSECLQRSLPPSVQPLALDGTSRRNAPFDIKMT